MKWFTLILLSLLVMSCGNGKSIDGVYYDTYGLISEDEVKADSIQYVPIKRNIIPAVFFSETIVAIVYIVGYDMYEPIAKKAK